MEKIIDLLKKELWAKEIGGEQVKAKKWVGKQISDNIEKVIGDEIVARGLGKGTPHPDTIVNFFNDNTNPSTRTLTIITWYLYGSPEKIYSFEEFEQDFSTKFKFSEEEKLGNNVNEIESTREKINLSNKLKFKQFASIFGFVMVFLLFIFWHKRNLTIPFYSNFSNSNLDSLEELGNYFLHPDSINLKIWNLETDETSGYLTMRTWLGDSWLDNPDYNPTIYNLLTKKVSCGECCEINLKIVDFNPNQRYQNAGLFLFGSFDQVPSLRYNLGSNSKVGRIQVAKRVATYETTDVFPFTDRSHRKRGEVYQVDPGHGLEQNCIDYIILQIKIRDKQAFFSYIVPHKSDPIVVGATPLPFNEVKYIGLSASQGRPDIPTPIHPVADIIPAHFDYLELKKCD